jgi:HEAT repeat protein
MPRTVDVLRKGTKDLWLEALQRPEADYPCQAALAIARAHQRGIKGMGTTVPTLLRTLDQPDRHLSVRLAVARALIELDAREAAPRLFREAESDSDLRAVIEPALARWDYRPARAVWLDRLGAPKPAGTGLLLAVRGLEVVREEKAIAGLRELVLSGGAPAAVRVAAARALSVIRTSGSEDDARKLIAAARPRGDIAHLAAALLLRHHKSDDGLRLLDGLALDRDPAVAANALARLVEVDSKRVVPALGQLLRNPDAEVRSFAAEVLFRQPSVDHVRLLAERLGDAHPAVRVKARRWLRKLAARPPYRKPVVDDATMVLAARGWRGQEQAIILLAQLGHKEAGRRMLELLRSDRPEVLVAAAWGLRKLAAAETLPGVLEYFERRLLAGRDEVPPEAFDQQLCQLAQLLGPAHFQRADAALRQLVFPATAPKPDPKNLQVFVGREARAASTWALGWIHAGKPIPDLVRGLEGRINAGVHEDPRVRRMAAIALGRMKAEAALGTLRRWCPGRKPSVDAVHNACGWAIEQIAGQPMLPPGTVEATPGGWFLMPAGQ